jgi:hypothetical protein
VPEKKQLEAKLHNTKASCGRHDPARKHRLNRIPDKQGVDLMDVKKNLVSMEKATYFDELSQDGKVKSKNE